MKNIAVVLSGCGVFDGAEISESVMCLLAISKLKAKYKCFAPDIQMHHTINHLDSSVCQNEKRNVLAEAARIARGDIENLDNLNLNDFDAIILPGGFGVAKNLSSYAFEGENMNVNESLKNILLKANQNKKPIGFICISPIIAAKIFGNKKVKLTIGKDKNTAKDIENFGAKHIEKNANEICVDENEKIVTTPAFMLADNLSECYDGIYKLVEEILVLCEK